MAKQPEGPPSAQGQQDALRRCQADLQGAQAQQRLHAVPAQNRPHMPSRDIAIHLASEEEAVQLLASSQTWLHDLFDDSIRLNRSDTLVAK